MLENTKLYVQLAIAVAVIIIGCGLLIAGFIVPPLGIIDNSLLIAFGETCSFVGALLGIDSVTSMFKPFKKKNAGESKIQE